MGFSQAPGLPYSKLGIPEDGDVASRAISKGKYIIWKGKNYFAKTDILQGETFVEDTNLTEIPDGALNGIAEELSASLGVRLEVQNVSVTGSGFVTIANIGTNKNLIELDGVFKRDTGTFIAIGMDINLVYNSSDGNIQLQQTFTGGTLSGTLYIHYLEG